MKVCTIENASTREIRFIGPRGVISNRCGVSYAAYVSQLARASKAGLRCNQTYSTVSGRLVLNVYC